MWNGLTGTSLPGVKVIRFGVEISSSPPGRSTRKHSVMNANWLIPQMFDDLEVHHDVDRGVSKRQRGQIGGDHLDRGSGSRTCATVAAS